MTLADVLPMRKGTKVVQAVAHVGFVVLFEREGALKKIEVEVVLGIQKIAPIGTETVKEGKLGQDNTAAAVCKQHTAVVLRRLGGR
jgi:hypothetical protein